MRLYKIDFDQINEMFKYNILIVDRLNSVSHTRIFMYTYR